MNNLSNKKNYLLLLFGLTILSTFIYARFLRTHLVRDIPFSLTFWGLTIIMVICCMYLYLVKSLFQPKKNSVILEGFMLYFKKPLQYITKSLHIVDGSIKNNNIIHPYYKKSKQYLINQIKDFSDIEYISSYFFLVLIPNYILLSIFLVDVFWLNKIKIFYYFIFLALLPLFYIYYNYCIVAIKEELFTELESRYTIVKIYDENYDYVVKFECRNPKARYDRTEVSIREYFDIQLKQKDVEYPEYNEENPDTYEIIYVGYAASRPEIYTQYEMENQKTIKESTPEELQLLQKPLRFIEPKLLALMEYIELNQYTHEVAYIKPLRIILYSLYFVAWFYILIKSIHTLPQNIVSIKDCLITFCNLTLPFSKRKCLELTTTVVIIIVIQCIRIFYH